MESVDFKTTKRVITEEEVPYLVKKKFFIIPPKIISMKLQYVPCWWVVLDYRVTILSKNNLREGTLDFVVDEVKGCSVMESNLSVKLEKTSADTRIIMHRKLTQAQAEKKAVIDARWKVVIGQYKRPPELSTVNIKEFYRPYYEVEVTYGKEREKQWIPADDYGNYFTYQ